MTRRTVRDAWYEIIIRTTLVNGACRELLSLMAVKHMTDRGYVRVPRKTLAAQLGIAEHRVTVRTAEAVKAGLLVRVSGGVNGQTVQYAAQLPPSEGVAERHPQPEVEGVAEAAPGRVAERHPETSSEGGSGCRRTTPIRARVTKTNPNNGAPPALERGAPKQHSGSTSGATGAALRALNSAGPPANPAHGRALATRQLHHACLIHPNDKLAPNGNCLGCIADGRVSA